MHGDINRYSKCTGWLKIFDISSINKNKIIIENKTTLLQRPLTTLLFLPTSVTYLDEVVSICKVSPQSGYHSYLSFVTTFIWPVYHQQFKGIYVMHYVAIILYQLKQIIRFTQRNQSIKDFYFTRKPVFF